MSTQARLADVLLREQGQESLLAWAMDERRSVNPPSWDEVAGRLDQVTNGEIRVGGRMLRKWLLAAESELEATR